MATAPVTPEVTPSNLRSEIQAAVDAQIQPVTAPAAAPQTQEGAPGAPVAPAPTQSEWGNLVKNQDGSYQVTLATGEVFKGSADEVIAKQAEAQYNTKKWGHDWKSKYESLQTPQPASEPQAQALSAEEIALYNWQLEGMFDALTRMPADAMSQKARQFAGLINQMYSGSESAALAAREMQAQSAYVDFCQSCPDFADTDEQTNILIGYLPQEMQGEKPTRIPTSDDFKRAHAMALYDKKYSPSVAPSSAPQVPRAPLMPSSGMASGQPAEQNPWTMPMDQLRKQVFGQQ